jgi:hypothetical protein
MRLCFTIRDLLWLTVVVALAVGWLADRHRLAGEFKLEIKQINAALEADAIRENKTELRQIREVETDQ